MYEAKYVKVIKSAKSNSKKLEIIQVSINRELTK